MHCAIPRTGCIIIQSNFRLVAQEFMVLTCVLCNSPDGLHNTNSHLTHSPYERMHTNQSANAFKLISVLTAAGFLQQRL